MYTNSLIYTLLATAVTQGAARAVTADALFRRHDAGTAGDCSILPRGTGPTPSPDTAEAFRASTAFSNAANSATTPAGYSAVVINSRAAISDPSYITFEYLTTSSYAVQYCANRCSNNVLGCKSFNIYYERDPTLDPGVNCPNPPSTTQIKCAYFAATVTSAQATNPGQFCADFEIAIAGSNAYNVIAAATTSSTTTAAATTSSTTKASTTAAATTSSSSTTKATTTPSTSSSTTRAVTSSSSSTTKAATTTSSSTTTSTRSAASTSTTKATSSSSSSTSAKTSSSSSTAKTTSSSTTAKTTSSSSSSSSAKTTSSSTTAKTSSMKTTSRITTTSVYRPRGTCFRIKGNNGVIAGKPIARGNGKENKNGEKSACSAKSGNSGNSGKSSKSVKNNEKHEQKDGEKSGESGKYHGQYHSKHYNKDGEKSGQSGNSGHSSKSYNKYHGKDPKNGEDSAKSYKHKKSNEKYHDKEGEKSSCSAKSGKSGNSGRSSGKSSGESSGKYGKLAYDTNNDSIFYLDGESNLVDAVTYAKYSRNVVKRGRYTHPDSFYGFAGVKGKYSGITCDQPRFEQGNSGRLTCYVEGKVQTYYASSDDKRIAFTNGASPYGSKVQWSPVGLDWEVAACPTSYKKHP